MDCDVASLQRRTDRLLGILTDRRRGAKRAMAELEAAGRDERIAEKAAALVREVARRTQELLEYHVSSLATLALEAVLPDPYRAVLEFEIKRGRSEAKILLERRGRKIRPMTAIGGGAVDVASLAFRASLWSIMKNRSRALLVLDEPFKFLHGEAQQSKACALLRELADRLKIQIIVVSQEEDGVMGAADLAYRVTQSKGISSAERIQGP